MLVSLVRCFMFRWDDEALVLMLNSWGELVAPALELDHTQTVEG